MGVQVLMLSSDLAKRSQVLSDVSAHRTDLGV